MRQRGVARAEVIEGDAHPGSTQHFDLPRYDPIIPTEIDVLAYLQHDLVQVDATFGEGLGDLLGEAARVEIRCRYVQADLLDEQSRVLPMTYVGSDDRHHAGRQLGGDMSVSRCFVERAGRKKIAASRSQSAQGFESHDEAGVQPQSPSRNS